MMAGVHVCDGINACEAALRRKKTAKLAASLLMTGGVVVSVKAHILSRGMMALSVARASWRAVAHRKITRAARMSTYGHCRRNNGMADQGDAHGGGAFFVSSFLPSIILRRRQSRRQYVFLPSTRAASRLAM